MLVNDSLLSSLYKASPPGSNGYYVDNSSKRSLLVAKSAMDDQRLMQLHHSGTLPVQHHAFVNISEERNKKANHF